MEEEKREEEIIEVEQEIHHLIYDKVYLTYLLREERDAVVLSYVEQYFPEESQVHQIRLMLKYPYFANKILDDFEIDNESKVNRLLDSLSHGKSKIITIIGGRGQGKTALGMFLIERAFKLGFNKNIYYIKKGDRPEWLPEWINHAQVMEDVPNNCLCMLDETAIEYSARNFRDDKNKTFTDRLVILRHKDISVILVTQHSKLVDINIRRLSDIIIYKKGADVDEAKKEDERAMILKRLMPKDKTWSLIEIKNEAIYYLVTTPLPEFWDDDKVSKTFKDFNPEEMMRKQRDHQLESELNIYREKEKIRAEELSKKGITETKVVMP